MQFGGAGHTCTRQSAMPQGRLPALLASNGSTDKIGCAPTARRQPPSAARSARMQLFIALSAVGSAKGQAGSAAGQEVCCPGLLRAPNLAALQGGNASDGHRSGACMASSLCTSLEVVVRAQGNGVWAGRNAGAGGGCSFLAAACATAGHHFRSLYASSKASMMPLYTLASLQYLSSVDTCIAAAEVSQSIPFSTGRSAVH